MNQRLSVVIPVRHEEPYLGECLDSVLEALAAVESAEIVVVDGGMGSGARELVARHRARDGRIRCIQNPRRVTGAAFNLGIQSARGEAIALVSAHSRVEPDFFVAALRRLDQGDADIVGGPVRTEPSGDQPLAWLLARVVSHPFGVGNSRFRISSQEAYVDAVPFAVFRRDVFDRVGLFEEALVRNQDTEFFGRVARGGLRVLLAPEVRSVYRARGTLGALLRQGFLNAYWNVLVWRWNSDAFQLRHAVPAIFTISLLATSLAAIAGSTGGILLGGLLAAYGIVALVAALDVLRLTGRAIAVLLPPLFLLYHVSYGAGSLVGLRWLMAVRRASTQA
jgi:glycosyltransferase involved in cell wall biosynthesis